MRLCVNNQTVFGGMLQQLVELISIVLRRRSISSSSGAASALGKKLLVLIAVKPPSTPGTAVPDCGVPTAAIRSHTLLKRRLKNEKVVPHSDEFVTDEGVYVNQVECFWSLVNPWLQKFRGLSKPGLEQSVRTYGFVRTLNLAGVPLSGLIDCFAVNVFR